jgi:hypothetical protein
VVCRQTVDVKGLSVVRNWENISRDKEQVSSLVL